MTPITTINAMTGHDIHLDASELGWAPGQWPAAVWVNCSTGTIMCDKQGRDERGTAIYRGRDFRTRVYVYND